MDAVKLRAWYSHRQGLDGRLLGTDPASVLAETGWARSVGGSAPYLSLFARCGASRERMDADLAAAVILESPAARACTYVIPGEEAALALRVAEGSGSLQEMNAARKLGVTDEEIDRLCQGVLRELAGGPLEPAALTAAVGPLTRSLGEEGKKKGIGTTMPLALGRLQAEGEIRRISLNGRLDNQRYKYASWEPNPLRGRAPTRAEAMEELARKFFDWIGPASVAEFAAFAALGVGAAKEACAGLGLVAVDATGLMMRQGAMEAFEAFRAPSEPRYVLTSSLDAIVLLRREMQSLIEPSDRERLIVGDKGATPLGLLGEAPSHLILDRGRIVGLWEYDPEAQEIVWSAFVGKSEGLMAAVRKMEAFVRDELGDARSFSLDSPKSRAPKIAALREAATV